MADARMLNSTFNANLNVVLRNNPCGVSVFPIKSVINSSGVSYPSLKVHYEGLKSSASSSEFLGCQAAMFGAEGGHTGGGAASNAVMGIGLAKAKAQKWWEKGLKPNMKEVSSAQDLVDSLKNAGDKLVVVDFFSPGCGGCKALHPKISQLAEMNPDVQFLQVNHEEHKSMCYSLNVHVLPFFRFYRGVEGRVCSFSCTNATIKKFKDALAKYGPDRCSLGPTKGLEEKELLALAANRDLSFTYTPEWEEPAPLPAEEETVEEAAPALAPLRLLLPLPSTSPKAAQETEEKSLMPARR